MTGVLSAHYNKPDRSENVANANTRLTSRASGSALGTKHATGVVRVVAVVMAMPLCLQKCNVKSSSKSSEDPLFLAAGSVTDAEFKTCRTQTLGPDEGGAQTPDLAWFHQNLVTAPAMFSRAERASDEGKRRMASSAVFPC